MTDRVENVKCPVCGSRNVKRRDLNLARCEQCLFLSPVGEFKHVDNAVETPIDAKHKLVEHYPPAEVMQAAALVCDYFKKRGHKKWALGGLQARNEEVLNLTVEIDEVRKYAAGFRCALVATKAIADLDFLIATQQRGLRILDDDETHDKVRDIVDMLRLIREEMGVK